MDEWYRHYIIHNVVISNSINQYTKWDQSVYPSIKSGKVRPAGSIPQDDHPYNATNNQMNNKSTLHIANTQLHPMFMPTAASAPQTSTTASSTNQLASLFTTNPYKRSTNTNSNTTAKQDSVNKIDYTSPIHLPPIHLNDATIPDNITLTAYKPPIHAPSTLFNIKILYHYIQSVELRSADHHKHIYYEDSVVSVIYDKYPKSTVHLLIIPKVSIPTIDHITTEHTVIIQYIHNIGLYIVHYLQSTSDTYKQLKFNLGYHRIPSLQPLHCHLISADLISHSLKHKKHWNSFTTPFFVSSQLLCNTLQSKQNPRDILITHERARQYEKQALNCNRVNCPAHALQNMSTLKHHIQQCKYQLPTNIQ